MVANGTTQTHLDLRPYIGAGTIAVATFMLVMQWRSGAQFVEGSLLDWADGIMTFAVGAAITFLVFLFARLGEKITFAWMASAILAWGLLLADGAGLDQVDGALAWGSDLAVLAVWTIVIIGVLKCTMDGRFPLASRVALVAGLVLHSLSVMTSLGDGSMFRLGAWSPVTLLGIDESLEFLALAFYFLGLVFALMSIRSLIPGPRQPLQWLAFQSSAGRSLAIAWERAAYGVWRLSNWREPFSNYYANSISRKLDRGRSHRTLGALRWSKELLSRNEGDRGAQFEEEGRRRFGILVSLGVKADDCVIEYGCGSLRIGQHFTRYLGAGRYWGLDITDRFYNDGLKLLPADLVAEKRPNLAVIGPAALAAARSAAADCVVAVAVMKHVPREEIDTFWRNICGLLKPSAVAIVDCNISDRYMRTSGKDWSYPEDLVRNLVAAHGPGRPVTFHFEKARHRFRGYDLRRASIVVGPLAVAVG